MATTTVVYGGEKANNPDGVLIAETGQWAARGEPIEVDSELAKRLIEQGTFTKATKSKER